MKLLLDFVYLFFLLAIVDSIKYNKAIIQGKGGVLVKEKLQRHEDSGNLVSNLRNHWVIGSSEWMAGLHGSKENFKEILGYSNVEWSFIWSTMAKNGAWNVPNITNKDGVKINNAPELFINFIAHDLQCNIIIFDLVLKRIQFCSGNRLLNDNVVVESPILLYNTGSHFQSVFPTDHTAFINIARQLSLDNLENLNLKLSHLLTQEHKQRNQDGSYVPSCNPNYQKRFKLDKIVPSPNNQDNIQIDDLSQTKVENNKVAKQVTEDIIQINEQRCQAKIPSIKDVSKKQNKCSQCKGCGKVFQRISSHLQSKKGAPCLSFYDQSKLDNCSSQNVEKENRTVENNESFVNLNVSSF